MFQYIVKRIIWLIPVVLCVAVIIFSLIRMVPGDPARQLLPRDATEEEYLAKRAEMGLDEPYLKQLGKFLSDVFLHFDFGTSYMSKTAIAGEIRPRLVRTGILGLMGISMAGLIGTVLGIISAVHAKQWQDNLCTILSMIGISMPSFWIALMLIIAFAVKLRWLPASGVGEFKYYILPSLAIGLHGIATFTRQMRSSMLDVIRADYITTARAKGLKESEIIYGHALPNAMIPVITVAGGFFGSVLAGSIAIETIFSIPGMGMYLVTAIGNRDYPVVQSCVVVLSVIFCLIMLLVDIAYAVVDPRIRERYAGRSRKAGAK